ncbi:hypothetical protein BpHYR1_008307 [Brachionus plicatilis]|uniref:Uncharacterized protein n=1 Tax=Brachionus plicatilis TaxID=10195 RepID=A0A3M7RYN4_BRAPC|nr:hypothetical protein BpHYR1_008307 [Brachionus plicatilis]
MLSVEVHKRLMHDSRSSLNSSCLRRFFFFGSGPHQLCARPTDLFLFVGFKLKIKKKIKNKPFNI